METLTIELVKGRKREFKFLGWKNDGLAFYATSPEGHPAVIEPVTVYPEDYKGRPYCFPRLIPREIFPKCLRMEWSPQHHRVLLQWRDAKMADVAGLRQEVARHYEVLAETPLDQLIGLSDAPGRLAEFLE